MDWDSALSHCKSSKMRLPPLEGKRVEELPSFATFTDSPCKYWTGRSYDSDRAYFLNGEFHNLYMKYEKLGVFCVR